MPRRGQSRALQEAEEVRLAHVEAFSLEGGADDGQGGPLAAELAGSVSDPIALRRRLGPGPGGREEGVDVGVPGEVADDRPNGIPVELEPPGDVVGGRGFEEVGAADLEAAVGWRLGLPEEAREIQGASHGNWVSIRQVSRPRGTPWEPFGPGGRGSAGREKGKKCGGSAREEVAGRRVKRSAGERELVAGLPNRHPSLEPKKG